MENSMANISDVLTNIKDMPSKIDIFKTYLSESTKVVEGLSLYMEGITQEKAIFKAGSVIKEASESVDLLKGKLQEMEGKYNLVKTMTDKTPEISENVSIDINGKNLSIAPISIAIIMSLSAGVLTSSVYLSKAISTLNEAILKHATLLENFKSGSLTEEAYIVEAEKIKLSVGSVAGQTGISILPAILTAGAVFGAFFLFIKSPIYKDLKKSIKGIW